VLDRTADVVTRDPARAEEVIEGLADLLRAMLDAAPGGRGEDQAPTARRELALVEACADVLALAFGRRVRVRCALPPALRDARVPAGGLRPVLATAAARLAARPGTAPPSDVEIRVTATAYPAPALPAISSVPIGELSARVVARDRARGTPRRAGVPPPPGAPAPSSGSPP
jgi:hypothetical protein